MAEVTRWEQDLYRAYRRNASPRVRGAIEFLLVRLDAYGANAFMFEKSFSSSAAAIAVLKASGLQLSDALQAKLNTLE